MLVWLAVFGGGGTVGVLLNYLMSGWIVHITLGSEYRGAADLLVWIAAAHALQAIQDVFELMICSQRRIQLQVVLQVGGGNGVGAQRFHSDSEARGTRGGHRNLHGAGVVMHFEFLPGRRSRSSLPSRCRSMTVQRVLHVGPLLEGSTTLQRMNAMKSLGHQVYPVDSFREVDQRHERDLTRRILTRVLGPIDWAGANGQIRRAVKEQEFDLVWIDKGLTVSQSTLKDVRERLPRCKVVGYSPDDMTYPANQSRSFIAGLPLYDIYFTTKSYGVAEIKALGCPRVEFVGNAYDPNTHHPLPVSPEDRARLGGSVGFIGQWEEERVQFLTHLGQNGIEVRVWGLTWERCRARHSNLRIENVPLWSRDYALALCAFDINLGFLRKVNRDLQTTRSIEIPACGAFMLAERTNEHLDLFVEGKEAEFFEGKGELLEKVQYYLAHPEKRRAIAAAGRERCLRSGYSNTERMRWCIEIAIGH